MKKLFAALALALFAVGAHAYAACDQITYQVDAWGNSVNKLVPPPSGCTGAQGLFLYDITTQQPKLYPFDSTLKISGGTFGVDSTALPATPFNFAFPSTRSAALSTDLQSGTPSKATIVTISASCTAALSLSGGNTCSMEARMSASSLTCSGGTVVGTWTNGNTGTLTVGLNTNQAIASSLTLHLPINGHFILCPTSGTFTVVTAVEQAIN